MVHQFLKNFIAGWAHAKEQAQAEAIANIKLCHDSMEKFHCTLADTILEETGKGLSALPEPILMGILVYEIEASLVAARKFQISAKYHKEFAASVLMRAGMPQDQARGMVHAVLVAPSGITELAKSSIDGAAGYEQLTLGTDALAEHVKATLNRLQNYQSLAQQIGI